MKVTQPGVYAMDAETYHANCTPTPALSAGFAWKMHAECPLKAWAASPLNPGYEREEKPQFDIGSAAHLLFLEPDLYADGVVVIDAPDWRTKAAKDAREAARADGKVPLLTKHAEMVRDMRLALRNGLPGVPSPTAPDFAKDAFVGGKAEQSYFYRDDAGLWRKWRPDYALPGVYVDYKTSATANPDDLQRLAFNLGWFSRAAFYVDCHKALTGEDVRYWFVVQEKEYPYLTEVFAIPGDYLEWGRKINRAAARTFARCVETGHWPRYPNALSGGADTAHLLDMPQWAGYRLQEQEDAGRFIPAPKPDRKLMDAARESQRPLDWPDVA